MRTRTKLMLSDITIGAKHLKAFRPVIVSKKSIQVASSLADLSPMLGPVVVDMIDGKEAPIGLIAASASSPVGGHNLLSQSMSRIMPLLQTARAVFFGGQLLMATITAPPRLRQFVSMPLAGGLRCRTALFAQLRGRIAFFGAVGTFHVPYIVPYPGGHINRGTGGRGDGCCLTCYTGAKGETPCLPAP